jgi:hypothetical protein
MSTFVSCCPIQRLTKLSNQPRYTPNLRSSVRNCFRPILRVGRSNLLPKNKSAAWCARCSCRVGPDLAAKWRSVRWTRARTSLRFACRSERLWPMRDREWFAWSRPFPSASREKPPGAGSLPRMAKNDLGPCVTCRNNFLPAFGSFHGAFFLEGTRTGFPRHGYELVSRNCAWDSTTPFCRGLPLEPAAKPLCSQLRVMDWSLFCKPTPPVEPLHKEQKRHCIRQMHGCWVQCSRNGPSRSQVRSTESCKRAWHCAVIL